MQQRAATRACKSVHENALPVHLSDRFRMVYLRGAAAATLIVDRGVWASWPAGWAWTDKGQV